jgi:hypothetical protein
MSNDEGMKENDEVPAFVGVWQNIMRVRTHLLWGAQAASLFISAACRDAVFIPANTSLRMLPASCRQLQAGSLCSSEKLAKRLHTRRFIRHWSFGIISSFVIRHSSFLR